MVVVFKIQKLSFAEELDEEEEEEGEQEPKSESKAKSNDESRKESESNGEKEKTSTNTDEEGNNSDDQSKVKLFKKRFGKNPNVDTSFLPDKERELEEDMLRYLISHKFSVYLFIISYNQMFREKLRQEWVERQEKLKNEDIDITYSYWDGSGHRRTILLKKGNTIQQFLYRCLEQLRKENQFNELKVASVDQLMYVKEDIILPHHYTFYDLIVTKARGKSGPLFIFEAYDDIRIQNDASIEKEESHAGKVVLRSWYERHKHIFPASRWEPYDPEKKWDKPYTTKDK